MPVTNYNDYEIYLQKNKTANNNIGRINEELQFWQNRLKENSEDIISQSKIAGLLAKRFSYSGNISEIHKADSLYKVVNNINRKISSGTFRSLAANSITQHKFQQAALYIDSALALGDDKFQSVLIEFDVAMELGNKYRAKKALHSLSEKNNFDYLIRQAKYKDHAEGDLNTAIELMEKAFEEIKNSNNQAIYLWTKSNLADMYAHNNEPKKAYSYYLDVLSKDPEYFHALKGIAWLAFSHDKDVEHAKQILTFLATEHPVPDYDLLLAEIAAYEKDEQGKRFHTNQFLSATQNPAYGDMYNKYRFNLYADELNDATKALQIAKKEVLNRPSPEAFSWLAWAYFKNHQPDLALQTIKYHVEKKCFEPEVVYRMGMIYKSTGDKNKAKELLNEARNSSLELGPVAIKEINAALNSF